uniref:Reverse transcriptase domain-containing protein n=1 Tax=Equus caballus TaxID=9796 RepID=A0A9L0RSB3_HORSE
MPQLGGPTTKIHNYVLGGFGEKKRRKEKEDWQQLLAQVPSFRKKKKMKNKNHMIIPIDTEKAFDKIQHTFMIKTLNKTGTEGKYLNMIKAIYYKPTANIHVHLLNFQPVSPSVFKVCLFQIQLS